METFTKTVPLAFNKLFFLGIEEPSASLIKTNKFSYSKNDRADILECIRSDFPPLFKREDYNTFWIDEYLCDYLKILDSYYPYSKFVLIKNENKKFNKIILSYFCGEDYAESYLRSKQFKYNDIILSSNIEEPKSSKFIMFDEGFDDKEKINIFLSDPVIC